MKLPINIVKSLAAAALLLPGFTSLSEAQATSPTVDPAYTLSVFAMGVPGKFTAPDSIAVTRNRVYIGYGNGNDPAGLDGKATQIVEYSKTGQQLFVYNVPGHNDGLKVDPYTGKIWAIQDEDGNPNIAILDPVTRQQSLYIFATPPPHGGGYDDIVFRKGEVFLSASNPANNPNTGPAIVQATLSGSSVEVSAVLEGDAAAKNIATGESVTLNLQDPDSMTLDPAGDLLMTSQADSELVLVRRPNTKYQSVLQIPLNSPFGTPQVDDTIFTPAADGFLLVSDTPNNAVYAIRKAQFAPGIAFSAGVGAPSGSAGTSVGFVGRLDLATGYLTPIVSGLGSPHGMAFVLANDVDWAASEQLCVEASK